MGTTASKHLPPRSEARAAIKRAFVESATTIEKVLTALAVLVANVRNQEQAALDMLRIELARGSWLFRRPVCEDIVAVLRADRGPQADFLGDCWNRIYDRYPLDY